MGEPLDTDTWYIVTLRNLSHGSDGLQVDINGQPAPSMMTSEFSGVDFGIFDGPLYIGGHPNVSAILVSGTVCVCVCLSVCVST